MPLFARDLGAGGADLNAHVEECVLPVPVLFAVIVTEAVARSS
jgi:hypothetical protein